MSIFDGMMALQMGQKHLQGWSQTVNKLFLPQRLFAVLPGDVMQQPMLITKVVVFIEPELRQRSRFTLPGFARKFFQQDLKLIRPLFAVIKIKIQE